jgi:hypothetical protein
VVGYDSIIPPGREGTIRPKIDLKGIHGAEFSKGITVVSNATNEPKLQLTLRGRVKALIALSTTNVDLKNRAPESVDITLTTEKPDLQVNKVYMKVPGNASGGPSWQSDLPLYLDYELVKSKQKDPEGNTVYTLKLWSKLELTEPRNGEITIETNYAEKPELTLRGNVTPGRK